jgi:hypothetical protein
MVRCSAGAGAAATGRYDKGDDWFAFVDLRAITHLSLQRRPELLTFCRGCYASGKEARTMNGLIYLVGLVVVIMVILSFLGLR